MNTPAATDRAPEAPSLGIQLGSRYALERDVQLMTSTEAPGSIVNTWNATEELVPAGTSFRIMGVHVTETDGVFAYQVAEHPKIRMIVAKPEDLGKSVILNRRGNSDTQPSSARLEHEPVRFRAGDTIHDKVRLVLTADGVGEDVAAKARVINQTRPENPPAFELENLATGTHLFVRKACTVRDGWHLKQGTVVTVTEATETRLSTQRGITKTLQVKLKGSAERYNRSKRQEEVKEITFMVSGEELAASFSPDTRKSDSTFQSLSPRRAAEIVTGHSMRVNDSPDTTVKGVRAAVAIVQNTELPPQPAPRRSSGGSRSHGR